MADIQKCEGGGQRGPLTVFRLIGDPAVLGVLVDAVGVAFGTLLGPEVFVGPWALLTVADLVLKHGPQARVAFMGWSGKAQTEPVTLLGEKAGEGQISHTTTSSSTSQGDSANS